MSERHLLTVGALVTLLMVAAAALLLGTESPADASSLSRTSAGWLAARRYLEEMGTRVALVDHDLDEPIGTGVLVLAFPWQRAAMDDVGEAVARQLRQGGSVLIAYSDREEPVQSQLLESLGLSWDERRPRPPRRPRRWRAYAAEEWVLSAEATEGARAVRVAARRHVPQPPVAATVLLRDAQGRAAAFLFPRRRGRVVVVPADAFANGRIANPGNADFLESLRQDLGGPWLFDEYHHGLRAAAGPAQTGPQRALLLYVLQVALVYALCAFAVVRRFGPAWREEAVTGGSAAVFLVGLGALHDRLGHHRDAGRLLVARAQELDPRVRLAATEAGDGKALLALARRVGALQKGRGKIE
ncbi:MAG TPA: DUF4350 domain-containing protein [Vicinamibacteria bacterium]